MNPEDLKFIQDNVPSMTETQILQAYYKNNNNVLETVLDLLKVEKKEEREKTDWEKRRDICDSYDREMQKIIKK